MPDLNGIARKRNDTFNEIIGAIFGVDKDNDIVTLWLPPLPHGRVYRIGQTKTGEKFIHQNVIADLQGRQIEPEGILKAWTINCE